MAETISHTRLRTWARYLLPRVLNNEPILYGQAAMEDTLTIED
jgi:hypothetical protein